ncbi:sulfotransferase [Leisingera sp. JC11]|uniref:sulfotransferase family protein n=1 Tax=Leisingera sp. JC11 TaxID=3042469 RepID=UPI003454768C
MTDRPPPPPGLPRFLIIGAMKAGTTTLYGDLQKQGGAALPPEKEPEDLLHAAVLSEAGTEAYRRKFAGLAGLPGEASTAYAKRPDHAAAGHARALLGPDLKLIYLLRDPIERMISHYKHEVGMGRETRDLNTALRQQSAYRNYSRYSWQLAPWQAHYGSSQILILHFEDYVADRQAGLQTVCDFLGLGPVAHAPSGVSNASGGKAVARRGSLAHRFSRSRFYQYRLKPYLGTALRDRLKGAVSEKVSLPETRLDPALRAELETFFAGDPLAARALRRRRAPA